MSATAEDEARARLEVAQLYEDMGQTEKAVRYLAGAAEILRAGGLISRAKEVYARILGLDPANQAARSALNVMAGGSGESPAPVAAPPKPSAPAASASATYVPPPAAVPTAPPPPRADGRPGLLVPTPLLYREAKTILAVRAQIIGPPDFGTFPYDPLPRVDPEVLAARAEARRKHEDALRKKASPRVGSSFGGPGGGGFTPPPRPAAPSPGAGPPPGVPYGAPPPGRGGPAYYPHQAPYRGAPAGEIRGGNRELADKIANRLKESEGKKPQR